MKYSLPVHSMVALNGNALTQDFSFKNNSSALVEYHDQRYERRLENFGDGTKLYMLTGLELIAMNRKNALRSTIIFVDIVVKISLRSKRK